MSVGLTPYRALTVGVTGLVAQASPGQLLGWFVSNKASSIRYLKVYDKATAPDETDTPVLTLELPATSAANVAFHGGIDFGAGVSIRATTGSADNDTGAPSTGDVKVNLFVRPVTQ